MTASSRWIASRAAHWFDEEPRPSYHVARRWFLRALGGVFAIAFVSLWVQVDGLIGARGILPVSDLLAAAREQLGARAPFVLPTLLWIDSSNGALHALCGAGTAVSLLLAAGLAPPLCLALLFVLYLSLVVAGQTFLAFQWDLLLLETAFFAIFFAPWEWRARTGREAPVSRVGLFLVRLLLFKLMFLSGVVKLTSGDASWWDLSALEYHYLTQPLPNPLAWWMAQAPAWCKQLSTLFALVVETVVPFGIWGPRRVRLAACALLVGLQLLITLTGNYGFFNWLAIVLCLPLVDDAVFPRVQHGVLRTRHGSALAQNVLAALVLAATLPLNAMYLVAAGFPRAPWPAPLERIASALDPLHVVNGYGLFRVMTKQRDEIEIEGSDDGIVWKPYRFRWKPGPLDRAPPRVAPHQPRLDWQMWFAALSSHSQARWFERLARRLLDGEPDVLALLDSNPFPEAPPRLLRARLYAYRFTTRAERRETGDWWRRELRGVYLPVVSKREP